MSDDTTAPGLSRNERIKTASNFLRGTIKEGLDAPLTGSIAEDDTQLTKFHGLYLQDDRDLRPERRKKRMEPAYAFMARVRLPGGICTPDQWLRMDKIATDYANGTLRLTTRQTWQFHGIIKQNLKNAFQAIDRACLDTLAACGDVNRNVLASSNPELSRAHAAAADLATRISTHLLPKTRAYREIWLDGERVVGQDPVDDEPLYGRTYLPRKFKTVVAVPPDNDVDVFAHDLGFVAITGDGGEILGWNVTVGGGMGMTHGDAATYPRTADVMAFCTPEQAVDVAEQVVTVQRDFGDRKERKHARLKYTIEDRGLAWFRAEVERRLGYPLEDPRPMAFAHTGDRYGWREDFEGNWHYTLFVENGRVKDAPGRPMMTGLREIARAHTGDFRLTANQNLIIAGVRPEDRGRIEGLLREHGLSNDGLSGLRRNAVACVALPTCGLSLAESERYLPTLVDALDEVLDEAGLRDDEIVIRMTGCPNGCARPYLAEIGLVGRGPGTYNLYLGAAFDGTRLNKLHRQDVGHDAIVAELRPLLHAYAKERDDGERFGDFVIRHGVVAPTLKGPDFHGGVRLG
ncbi:MAG TPA: NADPH-dependent assimilatory sulfite reductase hemoprotein subunit [Geminicoccaceae bacterium]